MSFDLEEVGVLGRDVVRLLLNRVALLLTSRSWVVLQNLSKSVECLAGYYIQMTFGYILDVDYKY